MKPEPPENAARSALQKVALVLVFIYQRFISPPLHWVAGPWCGCRFTPTCSEYARQALLHHGFLRGTWLSVRRLARCQPWNPGGVDEVPESRCAPSQRLVFSVRQEPLRSNEDFRDALLVITGATATGKTAFAIEKALALNAEILSCDSTLVYRGMDIGTAKPTPGERAAVPHHGLDLVEPDVPFSVSDYIVAATAAIRDIRARNRAVIITGGSGFYLKAFYRAVTDTIPVPPEVFARVRELAAAGPAALEAALLPFAPDKPDFLDWQNPRRVAKALERCLASGRPLAEIHAQFQNTPGPFDAERKHTVLLERSPEELSLLIEQRVRAMLASGLVDEVQALQTAGKFRSGLPAAQAVGYRETLAWLQTRSTDTETLAASIILSTRQLAAKQRKWFRTQIPIDEVCHL